MRVTVHNPCPRQLYRVVAALCIAFVACGRKVDVDGENRAIILVPVERRDIAINVSATGVLEPVREIEIKSKASGKILRLPVEVGDAVEAGVLLAQVDTTDVKATLRQKEADLEFRRAQYTIAERQKQRSDDLVRQGMISLDEHDRAVLDYASSHAALVGAETELEQARERVAETVVRAPMRGTILEKHVEVGQIIASATSQVTGGTTLMKMADLSVLQARVVIDARDLSRARPGLQATVVADAYPDREFKATTGKIEPQPQEKGNNTYFPMVITIDNREGLLLPGIKCKVEIEVERLDSALAVSIDAVATPEGARQIAPLLDIPPDSVSVALAKAPAENPRVGIVFVPDGAGFGPVAVGTGLRNWEYVQITSGLKEGAEVIIPPSAEVARQFREFREMIRRRTRTLGEG